MAIYFTAFTFSFFTAKKKQKRQSKTNSSAGFWVAKLPLLFSAHFSCSMG